MNQQKNSCVMAHFYSHSAVKTKNKTVKLSIDTSVPNMKDIDEAVALAAVLCFCATTTHQCRSCNELCCVFCANGEMNDHRHGDPTRCKVSGKTSTAGRTKKI